MATCIQSARRKPFNLKSGPKYKKPKWSRTPILKNCPQVKGIVTKITTMTPKKPNSAIRHVAKVSVTSYHRRSMKKLKVTARMPGKGYMCSRYNRVLVEGGRANDLPGVGYTVIRGKYDFAPLVTKSKRRRSIYGMSQPANLSSHVRRKDRKYLSNRD